MTREDGHSSLRFTEDEFKGIIRRFLRLIALDADAYLEANPDLAEAVEAGRYNDTPQKHFAEHGFFEGRKPCLEFDSASGGSTDHEAMLPDEYFHFVHRAQTAMPLGQWAEAQPVLRDVVDRFGRHPHALRLLAACHAKLGAYRRAALVFAETRHADLLTDDLLTLETTLRVNNRVYDALCCLEAALAHQARQVDRVALGLRIANLRADLGDLTGAMRTLRAIDPAAMGGAGIGLHH